MDAHTREVMFSSKRGDHCTPRALFNLLNREFEFNIDLAASPDNALLQNYYTEQNSAFDHSWSGHRGFCNPPYGRVIREWVNKAIEEKEVATTVMLLPARTDTQWFHKALPTVNEIRFFKSRLRFEGEKDVAPFPSLLLIWNGANTMHPGIDDYADENFRWTSVIL